MNKREQLHALSKRISTSVITGLCIFGTSAIVLIIMLFTVHNYIIILAVSVSMFGLGSLHMIATRYVQIKWFKDNFKMKDEETKKRFARRLWMTRYNITHSEINNLLEKA